MCVFSFLIFICFAVSLKKKCLDTLQAMRLQVKYLTESSTPNKTEVTTAIKNWEQYFDNVADHEVQFTVCV